MTVNIHDNESRYVPERGDILEKGRHRICYNPTGSGRSWEYRRPWLSDCWVNYGIHENDQND